MFVLNRRFQFPTLALKARNKQLAVMQWQFVMIQLRISECLDIMQAELAESRDEVVEQCKHHASLDLPHNAGSIVAGVTRAEGTKCQRCWNYSTQVGQDRDHPSLCERCSPVIRDMGFKLPSPEPAVLA